MIFVENRLWHFHFTVCIKKVGPYKRIINDGDWCWRLLDGEINIYHERRERFKTLSGLKQQYRLHLILVEMVFKNTL